MADVPPLTDEEIDLLNYALECHEGPLPFMITAARALARIEQDRAHIEELEQALRLNLAVAPDDPILITPVEQQIASLTAVLSACREALRHTVGTRHASYCICANCEDARAALARLEKA